MLCVMRPDSNCPIRLRILQCSLHHTSHTINAAQTADAAAATPPQSGSCAPDTSVLRSQDGEVTL